MRSEQREEIKILLHDCLCELQQHKRLSDDEYRGIIKYLAEGDACRKLLETQGIYTK